MVLVAQVGQEQVEARGLVQRTDERADILREDGQIKVADQVQAGVEMATSSNFIARW